MLEINNKSHQSCIKVDGKEVPMVTGYSIDHRNGDLLKVNITVAPMAILATFDDTMIGYEFVVEPFPTEMLVKLKNVVENELQKRSND